MTLNKQCIYYINIYIVLYNTLLLQCIVHCIHNVKFVMITMYVDIVFTMYLHCKLFFPTMSPLWQKIHCNYNVPTLSDWIPTTTTTTTTVTTM